MLNDHSSCPQQFSHKVTRHKEDMPSTALGFPKGKRVIEHYSILTPEAIGFFQVLLQP